MRVAIRQVSSSRPDHDGAGCDIRVSERNAESPAQGPPGAAPQLAKQGTVLEEVAAQELRDRKHDVAVWDLLEQRAVGRCRAIIDKLLRFSRAPASASERFDMGPVVRDTLAIVDLELERAGIHRAVSVDDGLWVEGDPGEVAQAVLNVLVNARDAVMRLPEGAPRRLGVRAYREKDRVMLEVADSGPGIEPAARDRIFEPFFTTKDVGQGVGLGLSITYDILKRHGARVEVGAQPGRGTLFRMAFPVKE